MNKDKIGIITADIIESTEINFEDRKMIFAQFNEGLNNIKKSYFIDYEWYRGDAFQVKSPNCVNSLRILLLIKFWIKSFEKEARKSYDVRISLGIGKSELTENQLSLSDGEAFRISGRNLDRLKIKNQTLIFDSNDSNSNALKIESLLLNTIIENVTSIQAKVLYYKLQNFKENDIAEKLNLAQSTVNQHSKSGNWKTIAKYLDYFEKLYVNE